MNVLVLCYAISPTRGSEYAVSWNYVTHMSRYHNLTILYGTSGDHMGDCREMNDFLETHCLPNVRFYKVAPSRLCNILNYPNVKGYFGFAFYWAYHEWHKLARQEAIRLCQITHFDVVHFLCPIGYREPGYLWELGMPYIWGPIGGTHNPSICLYKALPVCSRVKLACKSIVNILQLHYGRQLKHALQQTDILLTATTDSHNDFIHVHAKDNIYLPENGILGDVSLNYEKFVDCKRYRVVVAARIDANKAIIILLRSLIKMQYKERIIVDIIGDGPQLIRLKKYVKKHGIDDMVIFHGALPRAQVIEYFNKCHLHVITSISEGNPTVIWEAMSRGVPTLTLDHCGMHDVVCDKCGIRIPVDGYNAIIDNISCQLDELIASPKRFIELAEGTIECAKKFKWENRIPIFNKCYEDAILLHQKRRR